MFKGMVGRTNELVVFGSLAPYQYAHRHTLALLGPLRLETALVFFVTPRLLKPLVWAFVRAFPTR